MYKMKLVSKIIILGFLGLQCVLIAKTQDPPVNEMKMSQIINQPMIQTTMTPATKFEFQPLPYAYDALEPFIDKLTVEIHYSKHHRTYYDNFLKAALGTEVELMDLKDVFKDISKYPMAIRNNGGGYYNHTFYWEGMKANGGGVPKGNLATAINKTFSSFDEFKRLFSEAGKTRFGSGWAWLCMDNDSNLYICTTPNQDNPLMNLPATSAGQSDIADKKGIPLLTIDVWEHAYYLKYQNKRPDYIDAFWNVVNWEEVAKRYEIALKSLQVSPNI